MPGARAHVAWDLVVTVSRVHACRPWGAKRQRTTNQLLEQGRTFVFWTPDPRQQQRMVWLCRRALWGLHRCLAVFEHATFACAANERALVALCVPGWTSGGAGAAPPGCATGGACAPAAADCSPSPGGDTDGGAPGASAEAGPGQRAAWPPLH